MIIQRGLCEQEDKWKDIYTIANEDVTVRLAGGGGGRHGLKCQWTLQGNP